MLNVDVIKRRLYHVILSTGNVHGKFSAFLTRGTTSYRRRFPVGSSAFLRILFNVLCVYMFNSLS